MITIAQVERAIREVAVDEYIEGRTVAELSRQWGIAPNTLSDMLKRRGVYQPGRIGGPARKTHCKRNHDLAVHGRDKPRGGRECLECKRMRQRVTS